MLIFGLMDDVLIHTSSVDVNTGFCGRLVIDGGFCGEGGARIVSGDGALHVMKSVEEVSRKRW